MTLTFESVTFQVLRTRSVKQRVIALTLLLLCTTAFFPAGFSARAQSSSAQSAQVEPLGPCNRRTPLVISEIMYHPQDRPDGKDLEFIEVFNSQLWPENIGGYRLTGAVEFTFPAGTILSAEGFVVVAKAPADMSTVYGTVSALGPYTGKLQNNSGTVRLLNRSGAVLIEAPYSGNPPWPVAADGAGHSLVLARPSFGEGDPRAWAASDLIGGSPGGTESIGIEPLRPVMINEFLAGSTESEQDFIELYNHSNQEVDLSGCTLTDDASTNKYRFPPGTSILPRGFLSLDQTQLGFGLSSLGETIFLINSNQTRVLDAVLFEAQARSVSTGRSPDGAPIWRALASKTPGTTNNPPLVADIVINEIMYAPISHESDDEFVELYNQGTNLVDLSNWRFLDGIDFTLPTNTVIAPKGFLVVAKNTARLMTRYTHLNSSNLVGDYQGVLSDKGERLALARPEVILVTNQNQEVITTVRYILVDEVTYDDGGRWPKWTDGGGSSLELIDPRSDHRQPSNWADSDETAKAGWTVVEHTGRLDLGDASFPINFLQILALEAGEYAIDDVEVVGPAGTNMISNSSFESGLASWNLFGNHENSGLSETGGFGNSKGLHLRTTGRGDPGANCARVPLTSALSVNNTATLRAKVRWMRGHPEILLRLRGNYLEAFGPLAVPTNLGTPGTRNSRAVENAGPVIYAVTHSPILPETNQPVVVTARLQDPDGVSQAALYYRVDPGTNTIFTLPLLDDGTGGDAVAGDGISSATLPGQAAGKLISFYLQSSDGHQLPATTRFPNDAPARECLVRFGEPKPAGKFGTYRIWITQATSNRWVSRLKLSNTELDSTFVYGEHRVIYNAGALYAGSPYHSRLYTSPTGTACDYNCIFPADDPFLAAKGITLSWPGLTQSDGVDSTLQREQTCYWVASELGLPYNYRRYVNVFLNGVRRASIMEDTQQPGADVLEEWFPDDPDGDLYKVQLWYEFADDATSIDINSSVKPAALGNFTTMGGSKKTARYRWNWAPRAIQGTANNFTNLFALVDTVNTTDTNNYRALLESRIDMEQWMRTFAVEHIVGNWDSYGYGNGQNMYAYKPPGGVWKMLIWDMDVSLYQFSDPPTADLFKMTNPYFPSLNGDPAVVSRMYNTPVFRRAYWRALQDAVNGPLLSTNLKTLIENKHAAFLTNGINAFSPATITNYLNLRRNFIVTQLASVAANFALTSPAGTEFTTSQNEVTFSGTAPVGVRTIKVNGTEYSVTWTTVTNWSLNLPLYNQSNLFQFAGFDYWDGPLSNATASITIQFTGETNALAPTVFINEWMADNGSYLADPVDGDFDDWFELYNPTAQAVDLSNYYLTDNLTNKTQWRIPLGTILAAGGYRLVWADGETNQNGGADLHANFQLSRNGEAIGLFAPDGTLIDAVTFPAQTNNISQGRWPDGAGQFYFFSTPSPNGTNASPSSGNQSPVLSAIRDRGIGPEQRLLITNQASDLDGDQLSFSLGPGAPAGAKLDATNGIFSWRPGRSQAPSTNLIMIIVSDDGTPSLSATQTFSVILGHYLELSVGTNILRTGQSGSVPLQLYSTAGLTNLEFALEMASEHLTNWALVPAVNGALLESVSPTQIMIRLSATAGQSLQGTQQLGQLSFLAQSNRQSAFVPLAIADLAARSATENVTNFFPQHGRVVMIGDEPLLEANRPTGAGAASLTVFGKPGTNYVVEKATNWMGVTSWTRAFPIHLEGFFKVQADPGPTNHPIFYRAYQD